MIPKRPYVRWDGGVKIFTENCGDCHWYRRIGKESFCGWGVAFKYLVQGGKSIKCNLLNREPPKEDERSIHYLDELIKKLKEERFYSGRYPGGSKLMIIIEENQKNDMD